MLQYVYPAVFLLQEDGSCTAYIPDLNLSTDGDTIEEAYLFIKDYLMVYFKYANKMEEEPSMPTKFEKVLEKNKNSIVMLIDAIVENKWGIKYVIFRIF